MEELEGFIRDKIEKEHWTHEKLSRHLQQTYPGERGFSIRSIQRFCAMKDIHKTDRLTTGELDDIVAEASSMVCYFAPPV